MCVFLYVCMYICISFTNLCIYVSTVHKHHEWDIPRLYAY